MSDRPYDPITSTVASMWLRDAGLRDAADRQPEDAEATPAPAPDPSECEDCWRLPRLEGHHRNCPGRGDWQRDQEGDR